MCDKGSSEHFFAFAQSDNHKCSHGGLYSYKENLTKHFENLLNKILRHYSRQGPDYLGEGLYIKSTQTWDVIEFPEKVMAVAVDFVVIVCGVVFAVFVVGVVVKSKSGQ